MTFHAFFIAAVLGAFGSASALAATVNPLGGEVFIDRGNGYAAVQSATQGTAGDTVMVMAGSRAEVIYHDGCRQTVDVGAVVVIGETSPCALTDTVGGVDYTLVIGGLAVAGGIAAAIALSGGDSNDRPVSP